MSTDAPLLPNPETLPDDPAFLKQLVVQLFESLHKEQARVAQLEQQIHLLIKRFLRPASEKFDPNQLPLFDTSPDPHAPPTVDSLVPPPAASDDAKRSAKPGRHGRRRIPDTLKQQQVIHDLTPEQKRALGGEENLVQIGEVITRQYEWEPSCIFVIEHHQLKYVLRDAAEAAGDVNAGSVHDQADTDLAKVAHTAVDADLMFHSDTLTQSATSSTEVHDDSAGELSAATFAANDKDPSSSSDQQRAPSSDAPETATREPVVSASAAATRLPAELVAVIAASFTSPIIVAPKPPSAIPGGEAGPGLLAQTLVGKYADHVPLHRWERIYERHGVRFSRQTTCDWCARCADLFQPLYRLLRAEVLASFVIHTDDTPVNVRDAWAKAKFQARFWTYVGDEEHPLIWFDFTSTHQRAGPDAVLAQFCGYLQADGYGGYDDYEGLSLDDHSPILKVACWAHSRRKFHDALRTDRSLAQIALARIAQLYALEKELKQRAAQEWRELSLAARAALIAAERQSRAKPILTEFRRWLDEQFVKLLPKSPLAKAVGYARNQGEALCRYVEDGRLSIDNNAAERALRGICLGRKNWLFVGSEKGGRTAATHFTLIASAVRNGLDPFVYLRDLLVRLPLLGEQPSAEQLRPFLPHLWQPV